MRAVIGIYDAGLGRPSNETSGKAIWRGSARATSALISISIFAKDYGFTISPQGGLSSLFYRQGQPYFAATRVECADDEAAIQKAKQLVDGHDVELWDGPRFVTGLKSTDHK